MLPTEIEPLSDDPRELKVRIPIGLHVKLQTVKLLTGTTMSETVAAALANYLSTPGRRAL